MITRIWIVVLRLLKLSVPKLIEKARIIISAMTSNPYFPNPDPSLVDVSNRVLLLENAHLAGNTSLVRKLKREVIIMLTNLSYYVTKIANADPENGEVVINSAKMEAKRQGQRVGKQFGVRNSLITGKVLLDAPGIKRGTHKWNYAETVTGTDPIVWISLPDTLKANTSKSDLISGKRYSFRHATITRDGQSSWSNVLELIVL